VRKKDGGFKEFVSEAEEILEKLSQSLLEMESTEGRARIRPDVINAFFRGAHSLKGMSGMVGLAKVSEVSHALEDLLDKLRMGKVGLTEKVLRAMTQGIESLRELIRLVNAGKGESLDTESVLNGIREALNADEAAENDQSQKRTGIDPDLVKVLTEYEMHRLKENIQSGARLYEVSATFALDNFDKELAGIVGRLQHFGEVITTLPSSGMSPDSGITFVLVLGTQLDKEALLGKLGGEKVKIKEMPTGREADREADPTVQEGEEVGSIRSITPTVRVDIGRLDSLLNVVGELVVTKGVINQISRDITRDSNYSAIGTHLQKASSMLDRRLEELQEGLVEVRMIPLSQVFDRLVRIVRKLSKELGKEVDLQISGEETRLDKSMIEDIADPLMHLIRNAMDHGIESREDRVQAGKPEAGIITLRGIQKGNNVVIEVEDDGRGIDIAKVYKKGVERGILDGDREYSREDVLNVLFAPGFSTTEEVTELSGRGVGMDVVAKNVANLSGMIDIHTAEGEGTRFSLTLPITLVIIKALIVKVATETFAIPLSSVSESLMVESSDIDTIEGKEVIQLRGQTLSLLRLREIFDLGGDQPDEKIYIVVIGLAEKRLGLVVDLIEGQQDIVVKSLGDILRDRTPGIAGATELGNQQTILVLDSGALIEESFRATVHSGKAS
jgi:two-component system, chemotaxis family, sensor kinase CheA